MRRVRTLSTANGSAVEMSKSPGTSLTRNHPRPANPKAHDRNYLLLFVWLLAAEVLCPRGERRSSRPKICKEKERSPPSFLLA